MVSDNRAHLRRLPVYLLLCTSDSMKGEPIEAVNNGVQMLVSALQAEPQALETAYMSIITFADVAIELVSLTSIIDFPIPHLTAGGGGALGAALELLCDRIDSDLRLPSHQSKGDWKPMAFIMIDGLPTDNWQKGVAEVRKRSINVIACATGLEAPINILREITDNVVELKSASASDITKFFKWQTVSVTQQSQKL